TRIIRAFIEGPPALWGVCASRGGAPFKSASCIENVGPRRRLTRRKLLASQPAPGRDLFAGARRQPTGPMRPPASSMFLGGSGERVGVGRFRKAHDKRGLRVSGRIN